MEIELNLSKFWNCLSWIKNYLTSIGNKDDYVMLHLQFIFGCKICVHCICEQLNPSQIPHWMTTGTDRSLPLQHHTSTQTCTLSVSIFTIVKLLQKKFWPMPVRTRKVKFIFEEKSFWLYTNWTRTLNFMFPVLCILFNTYNLDWLIIARVIVLQPLLCLQFFAEFNSKLLESPNYITRRQAIKVDLTLMF